MSEHAAQLADRLFSSFVAPLVLGGKMRLGRPIGVRRAFALNEHHRPLDMSAWTRVQVARVRVARQIWPLDVVGELDTTLWAMSAALHDIVQSSHPVLADRFSGKRARQLLQLAARVLEHVPDCAHPGDALSRHTLFSRTMQIARTTTQVRWWTGRATFVGVDPPARLTAWPDVRRVSIDRDPVRLERLLAEGTLHRDAAQAAMLVFLQRTPLTDWASALRTWPAFGFTAQNLALGATLAGRRLIVRVLRAQPQLALETALGRALRTLTHPALGGALRLALELIGEHVLEETLHALHDPRRPPLSFQGDDDANLAQAAGALAARELIATRGDALSETERRGALQRLAPLTRGSVAARWEAAWPPALPAAS